MAKHTNGNISTVVNGIPSGILLCIGCAVSMSSDSRIIGAFLFSLGLFMIIRFRLGLFTGKAGYIATKPPGYIWEVILTIIGNMIGTAAGGTLLHFTRFGAAFADKAAEIMLVKMNDNPASMFVLAIFCGILMYCAVEGSRRSSNAGDHIGALFAAVFPVVVFIVCGFNHCIADMSYFFISGCANAHLAPLYFCMAILGNALGCNVIPLFKKVIDINF